MKKIFASILVLLMFASSFSVSAIVGEEKISDELNAVMCTATEDELIPIGVDTSLKRCDYRSITEEKINDFDSKLAPMFTEVFGKALPDEVRLIYFEDSYYNHFYLYATKSQIYKLAQQELTVSIDLVKDYFVFTPEENALIRRYFEKKGISRVREWESSVDIYPDASGFTLFYMEIGMMNCAIGTQVLGDVFIWSPSMGGEKNPTLIETEDRQGNFDNLTSVYNRGEIDILEVQKALPRATLVGDANLDDKLTVQDATKMQKVLAKVDPHIKWGGFICDTNKDGIFNIKDATYVQKKIALLV